MKVLKCNEAPVKAKTIPFNEIQNEEGVYKDADARLGAARLIVLRHSDGSSAVMYYDSRGILEPAAPNSWRGSKFVKTNEQVFFEIK